MVTRVCVLRAGKEYGPQHVQWLARQVPDLICLSDVAVPGVPTVPLRTGWPGWWAKLELFGGAIDGDLLYLDLDTVVLGDLAPLEAVGRTTALRDFYHPGLVGSGLMYIAEADKSAVWDVFTADPVGHMARCSKWPRWGDQGFLQEYMPAQRWQDVLPGAVVSYKAHCRRGVPPGARVVCFHGKPRPWEARETWIPKL